jgi:uncharacterized membrane protein
VVAGTTLAWIWPASPGDPAPDRQLFRRVLEAGVRIGFERTLQQDAAFGIRQLVDAACKALSPAVNDPYTAVQAVDHLSVIFCALAQRPLGNHVARHRRRGGHRARTAIPRIPRGDVRPHPPHGAHEPTVADALLRLLEACADVAGDDPELSTAIQDQAHIIIADAEREIPQPADLISAHAEAETLRQAVLSHRPTAP